MNYRYHHWRSSPWKKYYYYLTLQFEKGDMKIKSFSWEKISFLLVTLFIVWCGRDCCRPSVQNSHNIQEWSAQDLFFSQCPFYITSLAKDNNKHPRAHADVMHVLTTCNKTSALLSTNAQIWWLRKRCKKSKRVFLFIHIIAAYASTWAFVLAFLYLLWRFF